MLYKFPMPTRASGVKLYALPDQTLGIEVGRARNATMAYDHELAKGRTVTIGRPDIDEIIADAVRQVAAEDAMPKAGKSPLRSNDMKPDTMEYDDDASKVLSTLMDYLEDKLTPEQLDAVNQILASGDGETDADRIGEKSEPVGDRRGVARALMALMIGRSGSGRCRNRPRTFTRGCSPIKGGWRECRIKTGVGADGLSECGTCRIGRRDCEGGGCACPAGGARTGRRRGQCGRPGGHSDRRNCRGGPSGSWPSGGQARG